MRPLGWEQQGMSQVLSNASELEYSLLLPSSFSFFLLISVGTNGTQVQMMRMPRMTLTNAPCTMHHASCIVHRASCIVHRASCIVHRASCIMHHASCIVHHATCIMHHASCIMHYTSANGGNQHTPCSNCRTQLVKCNWSNVIGQIVKCGATQVCDKCWQNMNPTGSTASTATTASTTSSASSTSTTSSNRRSRKAACAYATPSEMLRETKGTRNNRSVEKGEEVAEEDTAAGESRRKRPMNEADQRYAKRRKGMHNKHKEWIAARDEDGEVEENNEMAFQCLVGYCHSSAQQGTTTMPQ